MAILRGQRTRKQAQKRLELERIIRPVSHFCHALLPRLENEAKTVVLKTWNNADIPEDTEGCGQIAGIVELVRLFASIAVLF